MTYPLWWFLGVGEMVFALSGLAAVLLMARRLTLLPPTSALWLLLIAWMVASMVQLDSFGRTIGAVYRLILFASLVALFIYVYNARRALTVRRLSGAMVIFLATMVVGNVAGLLYPLAQFTTPLAHVLPESLLQNELVAEMAYRRLTQFNPDAFNADLVAPRPSAPFLYTNGWGNAYSLIVPFVLAYVAEVRRGWRFWAALALLLGSLAPAALTLNRGMFVGLAVGAVYVVGRSALARRWTVVLVAVVLMAATAVAVVALPVQERIEARNADTASETVRAELYRETWSRALESPVLGWGAPRPAELAGAPSAGTQGQFWMTLFSYGFVGAALLVLGLALLSVRALRRFDAPHLLGGAVTSMALVEIVYYGFLPFGYFLVFTAAALMLRVQGPHQTHTAQPSEASLARVRGR